MREAEQVKKDIKPIVLDYDQTNGKLNIVDRGFLVWLENQDRAELLELAELPPGSIESYQVAPCGHPDQTPSSILLVQARIPVDTPCTPPRDDAHFQTGRLVHANLAIRCAEFEFGGELRFQS